MHQPAKPESIDVKALWRDQPPEEFPVPSPGGRALNGRRFRVMTRSEILAAITATLFFAAVLVWRFGANEVVMTTLLMIMVWVVITLLWLRKRLWLSKIDGFAAPGVEFYRGELEQRRKHLRNAWLWHGPVLLACMTLAGVAIGTGTLAYRRLAQALPLVTALVIWTAFSIRQRRREADAIQRELDEMAEASRSARK
jgi:hypothetical protein